MLRDYKKSYDLRDLNVIEIKRRHVKLTKAGCAPRHASKWCPNMNLLGRS